MADQGKSRTLLWPSDLALDLLGPVRLRNLAGEDQTPRSRKARAVLAIVTLSPRPVPREVLADLLWGDRGDEQAKASLRQSLYELRQLGAAGYLNISREAVALGTKRLQTDVGLLERQADGNDADALIESLRGVSMPILGSIDDLSPQLDNWLREARSSIIRQITGHGERAANHCIAQGDGRRARLLADELERLDPLDQDAARIGIMADLACGDEAAARRRFKRIDQRLREELGSPASPDLSVLLGPCGKAETRGEPKPQQLTAPDEARQARPWQRRRLSVIVVLIAACAAALFGVYRATLRAETPTIAVLPFDEVGGKQGYFAAGVSDEVLNLLSNQSNLKLMGRLTAQEIGERPNPIEVARDLGVTHLLDGSIRSSSDRLLVIVRLTRVADGAQLWSERYERRAGDIFAVQAEIAKAVAGRLSRSLMPAVQHPTSPVVYELYLAARRLARERRDLTLTEADRLLRRAIRLDPNYAPPYAELAQVLMLRSDHPTAYGTIPIVQAQQEAGQFARKAIALDPNLGDGYAALGLISLNLDGHSEPYMRKAVALSPQRPEFHRWHGETLAALDRNDEAVEEFRQAVEIDPLWGLNYDHLIGALFAVGRNDEARRQVQRFLALSTDARAKNLVVLSLRKLQSDLAGQLQAARALWKAYPNERQMRFNLAAILAQLGERRQSADLVGFDPLAKAALTGDGAELERQSEKLGASFWNQSRLWNATALLIRDGRSAAVVRFYDRNRNDLASNNGGEIAVPEAIVALRNTGRNADAAALLRQLEASNARLPNKGFLQKRKVVRQAAIAALNGDDAQALALLDAGSRRRPFDLIGIPAASIRFDPVFGRLADNPRFDPIDDRILQAVNRERARAGLQPLSREAWRRDNLTI
ncbi:hypothetical protein G7078_06725 [Sphingomonas sinipercae]|uniref:Bacterial transcriptional activator domain-containing protein n=1 Tax=Sphingomonas sinipercae TaxID=2714944 RepID=A0A6G7ZNK0_9SPHN|nr:BTAD domain-containing putative transcriptional regulator [Sphingomonas sinipercae]QIL02513.1 hypothetical protein G7078_06725 [Sphingomonas sinipercae]